MNEIWIDERGEINIPNDMNNAVVNVGCNQNVCIDKSFGPQCSSRIRVRHDFGPCEWVVEEENFNNGEWVERVRFYAQEFYKEKYENNNMGDD